MQGTGRWHSSCAWRNADSDLTLNVVVRFCECDWCRAADAYLCNVKGKKGEAGKI